MGESVMGRPIEILLVEDSPTDVLLTQDTLARFKLLNTIHVVDNGEDALAFLRREGPYTQAPRPDLVLLDLNLPRKDGREVLQEIKTDDRLRPIPVVVLTSSKDEEDIAKAYDLYANCYIPKPVEFAKFTEAVMCIGQFWFAVVALPSSISRSEA